MRQVIATSNFALMSFEKDQDEKLANTHKKLAKVIRQQKKDADE